VATNSGYRNRRVSQQRSALGLQLLTNVSQPRKCSLLVFVANLNSESACRVTACRSRHRRACNQSHQIGLARSHWFPFRTCECVSLTEMESPSLDPKLIYSIDSYTSLRVRAPLTANKSFAQSVAAVQFTIDSPDPFPLICKGMASSASKFQRAQHQEVRFLLNLHWALRKSSMQVLIETFGHSYHVKNAVFRETPTELLQTGIFSIHFFNAAICSLRQQNHLRVIWLAHLGYDAHSYTRSQCFLSTQESSSHQSFDCRTPKCQKGKTYLSVPTPPASSKNAVCVNGLSIHLMANALRICPCATTKTSQFDVASPFGFPITRA